MTRSRTPRLATIATIGLTAVILAGCTAAGGSQSASDASGGSLPSMVMPGTVPESDMSTGSTTTDSARSVVVNGSLSLTADDPLAASREVVRIVESAGGRVDIRSEQPASTGTPASAQLTTRIPSAELTPTLDAIEALGSVNRVSLSEADVTSTATDLEARITALRASADRLLALLENAATTADLIEVETALSQRQADLESLEAQQRTLTDQIDLATVSVDIGAPESAPVETPDNFWTGIGTGFGALVGVVGAALIGLGVLLPWLAVAAVITGVALVAMRARKRRAPTGGAATGRAATSATAAAAADHSAPGDDPAPAASAAENPDQRA